MKLRSDDIAVGTAVQLTSGGFTMTVVGIEGDNVSVVWHGQRGELNREILPLFALQKIGRAASSIHNFTDASGVHR